LYLINENVTIITRYGAITPFYQDRNYEKSLPIPEALLKNPEALRQLISFKIFGDRAKAIYKKDFYMNDPQAFKQYKQTSLITFLQAAHKVMRMPYENYNVREFGKYLTVFNVLTIEFSGDKIIIPANLNEVKKSNLQYACYKVEDKEERAIIKKMLELKYAAAIIDVYITTLRLKASNTPLYQHYRMPTSTKVREIWAPEDTLKDAMRHLLLPLTSAYDMKKKNSTQYAYIKERSIVDNAAVHRENKYIAKFDIKGFFDFCDWKLTEKYIKFLFPKDKFGPNYELYAKVKNVIKETLINPETGGLYQGNPVSGVLSNAILRPFSAYFANILSKQAEKPPKSINEMVDIVPEHEIKRFAVSVYADDITVSSNEKIDWNEAKRLSGIIRYTFEELELPFRLNLKKTSIARNNGRKITGVRINHKDELVVPRVKYMMLKSMCHRISHGKSITVPKNVFQGNLAYARFVDASGKIEKLIAKYHANLVEFGINLKLPEELMESYE
jgi:hypothetical protein